MILDRKAYAEGDIIFKEGEEGRCAYLVQTGKVQIVKSAVGGDLTLGNIGPGAIFGEMALMDGKPRMAMARAAEPTVLVIVSRAAFEEKLKKTDPFIRALLMIFVRNIRDMSDRL